MSKGVNVGSVLSDAFETFFSEQEGEDFFSSGVKSLDKATGKISSGCVVEIFGPESSGKTTLLLHLVADQQKHGVCCFIDSEHSLDIDYAKSIGVDVESLLVTQPTCFEQAFDIIDEIAESKMSRLVVVDSAVALIPKNEIESSVSFDFNSYATLISERLRKTSEICARTKTTLVFTNHVRKQFGIFGSETTPGGKALAFYSFLRLAIHRIYYIKYNDEIVGNRVEVNVVKNKFSAPFKTCEFSIYYGIGISSYLDVLELAVQKNVIEKKGTWFSFQGELLGQGVDSVASRFKKDKNLFDLIKSKI